MSPRRSARRSGPSATGTQQALLWLGRGLSHTLRVKIVISLLEAEAEFSSSDLAHQLGTSLGIIDYHVKYLLALGIIESKRTQQGRGSRQHFYSLVQDVRDVFGTVLEYPLQLE